MKYIRDLIITVVIAVAVFALLQVTVGSFKVYGLSMMPSVHDGEYIIVNKVAYCFDDPQRGEVVVFHSPNNSRSDLIKRIIALPGDTVEVKDGIVFVNDAPLVEPYISEPPKYLFYHREIPEGNYFVLGDNRNNSIDSHKGWTVPRENIIGKTCFTYWPPPEWRTIKHYNLDAGNQAAELGEVSLVMGMLCPAK